MPLVCAECEKQWLAGDPDRWRAYLPWEENLAEGEQPDLLIFCGLCSRREFDDEPELIE